MRITPPPVLIFCALMLVSCGSDRAVAADENRPLAQTQLETSESYDDLRPAIWKFSRANNFAVQEIVIRPQGKLDFSVRLYRDDISVTINRLRGESIKLAVFPLCACEVEKRIGLEGAADASLKGLREILSRKYGDGS